MKTILLSFEPYWFERMSTGQMSYEYRKHLPEDSATLTQAQSPPKKSAIYEWIRVKGWLGLWLLVAVASSCLRNSS